MNINIFIVLLLKNWISIWFYIKIVMFKLNFIFFMIFIDIIVFWIKDNFLVWFFFSIVLKERNFYVNINIYKVGVWVYKIFK